MGSWLPRHRGGWLLPAVLSTTAGAVDVIGFQALGGLFTAHITGNVVVLAAHYVIGGFSEVELRHLRVQRGRVAAPRPAGRRRPVGRLDAGVVHGVSPAVVQL